MKKRRQRKFKLSLRVYTPRGEVTTGNSFVIAFVVILVTLGVIFVGGVAPVATPPQTAPGKLTYKVKPPAKSTAQNSLQMYTFSGTASTPMPGPTKAPTDAPCIPGAGGSGGVAATGPICHPPGMPPKVLFNGDFETGNLSQWSSCQTKFDNGSCSNGSGYAITLVPDARQGRYAARFEIHEGDTVASGERTEVVSEAKGPVANEGDEFWYTWSEKFDNTFQNPNTDWFIILQWHDQGTGSPPVAVEVKQNGDIVVTHGGTGNNVHKLGTVHKGVWTDYTLHIKFSTSGGFVEGWENCVQTMPRYAAKTLGDGSTYLKEGIYRGHGDSHVEVVYADGMTVTGN